MTRVQDKVSGTKKRKSIRLSKVEMSSINKHAKEYNTIQEFAEETGINRDTLTRVLNLKRCSQDTYDRLVELKIISNAA